MLSEFAFPNIVQGIEVDNSVFEHEMTKSPASKKYIIFFTPRSGSSWLTGVLSSTQILGQPEEYINPEFLAEVAKSTNSKDPRGILEILKRRRKTPNGIFGIEVRGIDIELMVKLSFLRLSIATPLFSIFGAII